MEERRNGNAPEFSRHGLGYVYEPAGRGVRLIVDFITQHQEEMHAEIRVEATAAPGHLYQGRVSLAGPNSKAAFARQLREITESPDIPWVKIVEDVCAAVLQAERQGAPVHRVARDRPTTVLRHTVAPIVPENKPTILYGPWANAKGWLVVAMTVAVAAGIPMAGHATIRTNVLYLDWEDNEGTFDSRVWRLSLGMGLAEPPFDGIIYRIGHGTLRRQVHQIADLVAEYQIGMLVVDSVGLAAGASSEGQNYEDKALSMFEALRLLPVTQVLVDHVSGVGRKDSQLAGKAFGSEYKMAEAREAWEVRKDQSLGASHLIVGLYHVKSNHGPLLHPLGFRFDFDADEVRIEATEVRESGDLAGRVAVHERIREFLVRDGPHSAKDIAAELGISDNEVRTVTGRKRELFTKAPDGRFGVFPEREQGFSVPDDEIPF